MPKKKDFLSEVRKESKANSFILLQETKESIIDDLHKAENSKNVRQHQYRLLQRYKLIRNGEDEQLVKRTNENVATTKPRKVLSIDDAFTHVIH